MHFLVETIETSYPDLINFYKEVMHIDKAARASCETIEKVLKQAGAELGQAQLPTGICLYFN